MNTKLFIPFLLFILITCASHPSAAAAEERQAVKVGLIYPLTGTMSTFGEDMAKALPLLENKFNSEQDRYHFVLLIEDGKFGQTNAAITAAKKLVGVDGARFLVVGSSGEILQIAPFVETAKVLAVTGFSSHPDVKKAGDFVFRTYIDAGRGIELIVDDLRRKQISRLAVFSEESSFTSAIKESLHEALGDELVFSDDYAPGDADFKTLILKARSKNPQAYYLNTAAPTSFVTLLKQLRDNGVREPFYTYYVPSLKEVQESLGSRLDGTLYLDYPDTPDSSEDFKKFLIEFEAANNGTVKAPFNFKTNYNAVKVVYDAVVSVGPDPIKVKEYLYKYDQPSATGRLRFDANGDVVDLNLVLKTFKSEQ